MKSLVVILCCVLLVFIISRLTTFATLKWKVLPKEMMANSRKKWKVHHFVYGNVLLVAAGFLSLVYGVSAEYLIIPYGIGLGLVLDEFPHWMGDVKELQRNVPIIPGALVAVFTGLTILAVLIIIELF